MLFQSSCQVFVGQTILPPVTVAVLNYNGLATLPSTLQALQKMDYPEYKVLVLDNQSTDGSREWLIDYAAQDPDRLKLLLLDKNSGAAGGRQTLLEQAASDYVLLLDNDIIVEPDTLLRLVQVMEAVPQAAAVHPEICDPSDPTVHHYNGGWLNFLGVFISRQPPDPRQPRPEYEVFATVPAGALLVDRRTALHVGGFDPDFFFNMEDGDFTSRLTLAGLLCLNVPGARVQHNSRPRRASKVYLQVRNRLFFMTKLYSLRTLLLAAPALLVFELFQAVFLLFKGCGRDYLRGCLAFLASLPQALKKRRRFMPHKRLRDRDWLSSGEMYAPPALVKSRLTRLILKSWSSFFGLYWKLIRRWC